MTGHELLMRNIALTCNALGLVSLFILIPIFEALGAAVGLALMLIVQNLVAMYFVLEAFANLDVAWPQPFTIK